MVLMSSELRRYVGGLPHGESPITAMLSGRYRPESIPVSDVDLQEFEDTLEKIRGESSVSTDVDDDHGAPLSLALAKSLRCLAPRDLADPNFWLWLSIEKYPHFVLRRWLYDTLTEDEKQRLLIVLNSIDMNRPVRPVIKEWLSELGKEGHTKLNKVQHRFLARTSLEGYSRHAFARMYWAGEALRGCPDQKELLKTLWKQNQTFQQAIFERRLGLHPEAVAACLRWRRENPGPKVSEKIASRAVKNLNHHLSLYMTEFLDADDLKGLLSG